MDAGRHRPRPVGRPASFRSSARCRAARWSTPRARNVGRRHRHRRDLRQRSGLCDASGLSGGAVGGGPSCARELRLGPAMAAISLGLVGHAAIGERLGRNARFASIGNGLAAAAMGACGCFLSRARCLRRHRPAADSGAAGASRNCTARDRSGARARRAAATASPKDRRPGQADILCQPAAPHLRRLSVAVPSRQRRHAAADGQRGDDALGPMGDNADRGLHRRAAALVALCRRGSETGHRSGAAGRCC